MCSDIRNPRLLLVDDDQDQLNVLRFLLERGGYQVTAACGGAAALVEARRHEFDLIVCDVVMPDLSGPEFVNSFRKVSARPNAPVVLLTAGKEAFEGQGFDMHAVSFRADAFCLKQHATTQLLPQIKSLLLAGG